MSSNVSIATAKKISSFTDLDVWKQGHVLVLKIYDVTKSFPTAEQFGLTDQLRRAAVSVTSNVAEGFKRSSNKEKIRYFRISLSSITEIQNQLLIARDVGWITKETFLELADQTIRTSKIMNGLISKTRSFAQYS